MSDVHILLQEALEAFREREMGGRLFSCTTGGAPIAPEVLDFLQDVLIAPVLSLYGNTECGAHHLAHLPIFYSGCLNAS